MKTCIECGEDFEVKRSGPNSRCPACVRAHTISKGRDESVGVGNLTQVRVWDRESIDDRLRFGFSLMRGRDE